MRFPLTGTSDLWDDPLRPYIPSTLGDGYAYRLRTAALSDVLRYIRVTRR